MASGNDDSGKVDPVADPKDKDDDTKLPILKSIKNDSSKGLQLESQDFHKKDNEGKHHTDKFELDNLVIRRGQDWKFTLTFDRDVDKSDDVILLQFAFGKRPKLSNGSLVRLNLDLDSKTQDGDKPQDGDKAPVGKWTALVSNVKDKEVEITVQTPANAFVGKHEVYVETKLKTDSDDDSLRRFELKDQEVIILFNAWNKDDVVYMEKEEERQEYVMNEYGQVWVGSDDNDFPKAWSFGQFNKVTMEVLLYLMDRADQGDAAKRSPVTFARALASLTNNRDNKGVVEGRWTETFPDNSTSPWVWTGSRKILEEYAKTGLPVQYGQCWVFAGVLTTLLRAAGIPTRIITNFESGHDADKSMTIDFHFDADDKPMPIWDDSVWSFHVWCESFFKRNDLPTGYDGWQVVDSTPQEASDGLMRVGPTPVKAVKEGHVWVNFDAQFVFGEVNGDRLIWKQKGKEFELTGIDRSGIGQNMTTKAVGANTRVDVTGEYKYPEGSDEERRITKSVQEYGSKADMDIYEKKIPEDVKFSVVPPRQIEIGWGFEVNVKAVNTSKESRHITGRITVLSAYHTGVPGRMIAEKTFKLDLKAGEETYFGIRLKADDYVMKINPEATMQIYANFNVKETKQEFGAVKGFSLLKPLVFIRIPDNIHVNQGSKCTVTFTNPLPVALTNGLFSLDGTFIVSPDVFKIPNPIQPSQTVSYEFEIRPKQDGDRQITACFTSDQLSGANGSIGFQVLPAIPTDFPSL